MNERTEQIKAAMADEAFFKSCIEAENEEAVQKLFAGKGIEMSLTEIELMKEMVGAVADGRITEEQLEKIAQAGELSEDELEQAAGGFGGGWAESSHSDLFNKLFGVPNGGWRDEIRIEYSGLKVGSWVVAGAVAAAGAAYGIYKYKDEIASGVSTAYGWVKDNITRW